MIRLLAITGASILILILILAAVRAVGGLYKPPSLMLLEEHQCEPKPCWHGIHLDHTTLAEARAILLADINFIVIPSDSRICWFTIAEPMWYGCVWGDVYRDDKVAQYLYLRSPKNTLRLGDLIVFLGQPSGISPCSIYGVPEYGFKGISIVMSLVFNTDENLIGDTSISAFNPQNPVQWDVNPSFPIFAIYKGHLMLSMMQPWRGFRSKMVNDCGG